MLPATGLFVDEVPRQPDDVGEESLGESVLADDAARDVVSVRGQLELATVTSDVALIDQSLDHLRDRRRGLVESFGDASLDDRHTLVRELLDDLEVLLERRMELIAHVAPSSS